MLRNALFCLSVTNAGHRSYSENFVCQYGIRWGFCALGAGGELEREGKELSLDAVIWIQAVDMK